MSNTTIIEQAFAAQDALKTLIAADSAFSGIPVDTGPPLTPKLEHAWVSCVVESQVAPVGSNLSPLASDPEIAFGLIVQQYAGRDWTAIRARMAELAAAGELVIQANPTLSGTASYAHPARFSLHEAQVGDREVRLTAVYILKLSQYAATSG